MEQNMKDRRVQRTRKALQTAFVELVLEKGYQAITIQDLIDRANIGRTTFYAHYHDKEDLLRNQFDSVHQAFEEHITQVLQWAASNDSKTLQVTNLPLIMLRYVQQDYHLFKALLGKSSSGIHLSYVQDYLTQYLHKLINNFSKTELTDKQLEATAHYISGALLGLLIWWIDNDIPCEVEELYTLMMRLLEPGLATVLNIEPLSDIFASGI